MLDVSTKPIDSGLTALVALLRFHGVAAEPDQIAHRFGGTAIGLAEMLRCARECELKARVIRFGWRRLVASPLPAIGALRNGTFTVIVKASQDQVLIWDSSAPRPQMLARSAFEDRWDGSVVFMTRRRSMHDLAGRFGIGWFGAAIQKYRYLIGEVFLFSLFLQLFALVSPLFFQVVIDKTLVHHSQSTLDVLIIGLVGIAFFETMLGMLRTHLFAHTTNRIDVELGARLFRHLLALPMAYFHARRIGDSVARVRELENIRNFLTSSAMTLVIDALFTCVFIAVMFLYSPMMTCIVLASFPFYIGISVAVTPLFRARLDEKFRRGAENQAFLVESVAGIETLKVMAIEPQAHRRWEEQLAAYVSSSFRVLSLGNVASQSVQFVNKIVMAAILYVGARSVIGGSLTVGELVAFNMLAGHVSAPVLRLAGLWQDFHQARLSIARLGDILNTPAEPHFNVTRTALPAVIGDVRFECVSFRYRFDGPEILKDISLDVPAGQVVGIVGSSGSGKSTFAKLIERLYVPDAGRICVDGVDLAEIDTAWLRRQMGVVTQENVLFNATVRNNIALANPATPTEQILAASRLAGSHDFILKLPDGYDTIIGERGCTLSGGQRQRIAIARALVSNPRILIFDEATSALDYESERIIQENMREIVKGRTAFIIAHRLLAVRSADRIVTIEQGRIVEDGAHEALLRSGGRYAALYAMQM